MNYQEILVQLLVQIQDQVHPLKKQEENLKLKLHQKYDDLELQINQNNDTQKGFSDLIQIMEDIDQIYINCQKLEFLIRIMNLIIKIIQQNLGQQQCLNKYLTYLKYMIVQYFDDSQFEKVKNKIEIYYLYLSFVIDGNNKLDFFTTQSEGLYFLDDFLQLKKISKNHFIHILKKNYFNLPIKSIKINHQPRITQHHMKILKTSQCFSHSQQCENKK